jgi:hypothetical protein
VQNNILKSPLLTTVVCTALALAISIASVYLIDALTASSANDDAADALPPEVKDFLKEHKLSEHEQLLSKHGMISLLFLKKSLHFPAQLGELFDKLPPIVKTRCSVGHPPLTTPDMLLPIIDPPHTKTIR